MLAFYKSKSMSGIQGYLQAWRQKVRKRHFSIPDMVWDTNFVIELATTKTDLETVFRLQHESYVERNLMRPHPSGLRCIVHHFLPQTQHVVVKFHNVIVGSVTLIADSNLGLPADRFFEGELRDYRARGEKLVELSAFVIDKSFKSSFVPLSHLMMKYAFNYIQKHMESSQIILTVHPNQLVFFQDHWFFQQSSDVIKFHSSKNAFTTLMTHSLDRVSQHRFKSSFPSQDITRNTAIYIEQSDERFFYPKRNVGQVVHPVMTPELLEYFFLQQTNLYEDLDLNTRQVFLEMYLQFFGETEIERFLNVERELTLKEFRIPVSAKVSVQSGDKSFVGKIRDITASGCFIEIPHEIPNTGMGSLSLSFKLGESELNVQGRPSWQNMRNQIRYGHGYGIKFDKPIPEIRNEISSYLRMRRAA